MMRTRFISTPRPFRVFRQSFRLMATPSRVARVKWAVVWLELMPV